jgi:hypothetical protein
VILGSGGASCQKWFIDGLLAGFLLTSAEEFLLTFGDCLACHAVVRIFGLSALTIGLATVLVVLLTVFLGFL